MAKTAPAPSSVSKSVTKSKIEQVERPIYNGRPAGRRDPPVTIYHKAFAELKEALRDPTNVVDCAEQERVEHTDCLLYQRISMTVRTIVTSWLLAL